MTGEEIKQQCEALYRQIKDAEDRLKELRKSCEHEITFEDLYSWRAGSVVMTTICSYCGTPLNQTNK